MADTENMMAAPAVRVSFKKSELRWANGRSTKKPRGNKTVRVLDIVISISAILFLLPVLVVVAILVRLQDGGPIIFRQPRIGMNGEVFFCLKFRSMRVDASAVLERLLETDLKLRAEWETHQKFRNDPRITKLGNFLRKSSIDELPQLLNVIRGEMSLVGPRPIVQSEVNKYGRSFKFYTSVQPGITGLWQVSGRSDVNYSRRVALDRVFARKACLALYLGILIKTIPAVLTRKGSY